MEGPCVLQPVAKRDGGADLFPQRVLGRIQRDGLFLLPPADAQLGQRFQSFSRHVTIAHPAEERQGLPQPHLGLGEVALPASHEAEPEERRSRAALAADLPVEPQALLVQPRRFFEATFRERHGPQPRECESHVQPVLGLAPEIERFLLPRAGAGPVTAGIREHPERTQAVRDGPPHAEGLPDRQALLQHRGRPVVLALAAGEAAQPPEGVGDMMRRADPPAEAHHLLQAYETSR